MPQRLLILFSVFLCVPVIDCKWSLLSALRELPTLKLPALKFPELKLPTLKFPTLKFPYAVKSLPRLKLPEHTPFPEIEDATSLRELVIGLGLIYEPHEVVTVDGYVLNLNRIVDPRLKDKPRRGPPILMVNGLMMQSEAWLIQGNPRHNLAIAWLEAGYDIWLGDQRGTLRSRRHVVYNDQQKRFWDFTFHEVGVYDLPAFIDYILSVTGYPKLVYAGLSLGCTFFFVMCSEIPLYQNKIYGSVQIVPVGVVPSIYQMPPQTQMSITTIDTLMGLYKNFGVMYIRDLPVIKTNTVRWCNATTDLWLVSFAFGIGDGGQYDRDDFCYQLALPFGGTSILTVLHTIQLYKTGNFQQYDYGLVGNLWKYGSAVPPFYDFRRVWAPTAVYYSDIDPFAPAKEVEKLLTHFTGPTYGCVMKGLTHVGSAIDSRFKYFLNDFVDLVDSMTGRSDIKKAIDGGASCSPDVSAHG